MSVKFEKMLNQTTTATTSDYSPAKSTTSSSSSNAGSNRYHFSAGMIPAQPHKTTTTTASSPLARSNSLRIGKKSDPIVDYGIVTFDFDFRFHLQFRSIFTTTSGATGHGGVELTIDTVS